MTQLPTYLDLLFPALKALEAKGGSASNQEMLEQVASDMDAPHGNRPPIRVISHRLGWARTHLKYIGAVENPSRSVWAITERGRKISNPEEARILVSQEREKRFGLPQERIADDRVADENAPAEMDGAEPHLEEDVEEALPALAKAATAIEWLREHPDHWKEEVLSSLRNMNPAAFERLCQRVLREKGFTKVEVTGKSGDGGIDGVGVLRVNLLSFHVRFQCKRYAGSVGAGAIRDFRGAMVGRADKGLFITTGSFTQGAQREAVRDGAPAIDLIDGSEFCHLLKDLNLGVKTEQVEVIRPDEEFLAKM